MGQTEDMTTLARLRSALEEYENAENPPVEKLIESVIDFVVATGPCDEAEFDEPYCNDEDCKYCNMARALDYHENAVRG